MSKATQASKAETISRLAEVRSQVLAIAVSGRCTPEDSDTLREVVWEIEQAMKEVSR